MLLLLIAASIAFGSSQVSYETVCEEGTLSTSFDYVPLLLSAQLYFTPSNGEPRRLLVDKKEVKDPRLDVSFTRLRWENLTRKDDGTIAISYDDDRLYDMLRVTISDCATKVTRYYGDKYYSSIPRKAEFLEYTPSHSLEKSHILWNRSDPRSSQYDRWQVRGNTWELLRVSQADNGYYTFRRRDGVKLSKSLLTVREKSEDFEVTENEELRIERFAWGIIFTAKGQNKRQKLVEDYGQVEDSSSKKHVDFSGRLTVTSSSITINPVKVTDSGAYQFIDKQGNVAFKATVRVNPDHSPPFAYVLPIVGIAIIVILCCCCVRKRCCKKSPPKRGSAPQSAPAPEPAPAPAPSPARPTYYHSRTPIAQPRNSPAPPTPPSAFSYQPVKTNVPPESASTSAGPPVYNPVNIPLNHPPPEAVAPGGPSFSSDWLASGPEPTFELKGNIFPSAPPLDSNTSDVYTSDKLNFH